MAYECEDEDFLVMVYRNAEIFIITDTLVPTRRSSDLLPNVPSVFCRCGEVEERKGAGGIRENKQQ